MRSYGIPMSRKGVPWPGAMFWGEPHTSEKLGVVITYTSNYGHTRKSKQFPYLVVQDNKLTLLV